MKCPKCKKDIGEHTKTCPECGAQLETVCAHKDCGRTLKAFWKYCPECHAANPGYIDPLGVESADAEPTGLEESGVETEYSYTKGEY